MALHIKGRIETERNGVILNVTWIANRKDHRKASETNPHSRKHQDSEGYWCVMSLSLSTVGDVVLKEVIDIIPGNGGTLSQYLAVLTTRGDTDTV